MIHHAVDYCKLDMLPVEQSEAFRNFVRDHGEEQAKELIYEVVHPPMEEADA